MYSEKIKNHWDRIFNQDENGFDKVFKTTLEEVEMLTKDYNFSLVPKEPYRSDTVFSKDWQTDAICRRCGEIEDVLKKYYVRNREDLDRRLANSDKLGETLEQTEGLPLEVVIELVKDLNYIWVVDPKEENDSFGQPVEIPTRDITVDFEHKELVVYNECDNEEWYRFPFEKYKKTWWLKNDTPITAVEDSNKKE